MKTLALLILLAIKVAAEPTDTGFQKILEMKRWALLHCPQQKSNLALSAGPEPKGPWSHPMGNQFAGPRVLVCANDEHPWEFTEDDRKGPGRHYGHAVFLLLEIQRHSSRMELLWPPPVHWFP